MQQADYTEQVFGAQIGCQENAPELDGADRAAVSAQTEATEDRGAGALAQGASGGDAFEHGAPGADDRALQRRGQVLHFPH